MRFLPRILIIDRNEDQQSIKASLNIFGYKKFNCSGSGHAGLRQIKKHIDISIVLASMELHDLHGLELLRKIIARWPHVKVIMMSFKDEANAVVEAIKNGAYDFIAKPFTAARLDHLIKNCVNWVESEDIIAYFSGQIFLSYAREDVRIVEQVYQNLKAAGYKPCMDTQDLAPAVLWEQCINDNIQKSIFFLAFIYRASVNKRGMVQKELRIALDVLDKLLDSDIYLIPIRIEDCPVPESLKKYQWVDLFKDDSWDKLMKGIKEGLRQRAEI